MLQCRFLKGNFRASVLEDLGEGRIDAGRLSDIKLL